MQFVNAQTDTLEVCQYETFIDAFDTGILESGANGDAFLEVEMTATNGIVLLFDTGNSYYESEFYYNANDDFYGLDSIFVSEHYWHTAFGTTQLLEYYIYVNVEECIDCEGVSGGNTFADDCGVCVESILAENYNQDCIDCAGNIFGNSVIDDCGDCVLPENFNEACTDCAGVLNGDAVIDGCGNCLSPTDPDFDNCPCANSPTGFVEDNCGNCVAPNDPYFDTCNYNSASIGDTIGFYLQEFDFYTDYVTEYIVELNEYLSACAEIYAEYGCFGNAWGNGLDEINITGGEIINIFEYATYYRVEFIVEDTLVFLDYSTEVYIGQYSGCSELSYFECNGNYIPPDDYYFLIDYQSAEDSLIIDLNYYDCNSDLNGPAIVDSCGVCLLPEDPEFNVCLDCAGTVNGDFILDECGECLLPEDPEFNACIETNINELNVVVDLKVYPNPTNEIVFIEMDNLEEVKVYDLQGKMVFNTNERSFETNSWAEGIYLLELISINGEKTIQKLMIKH